MLENFRSDISSCAKKYSNVVLICDDDLYDRNFEKSFSARQFHFGKSTANILAAACGLAYVGKLPFVLVKASEILAATDQIKRLIVDPNLNVKIIAVGEGENGEIVSSIEGLNHIVVDNAGDLEKTVFDMANSYGPSYLALKA